MLARLPVASGDPALFAMLAGVLLLIGLALGLVVAGAFMVLRGSEERRKLGKRLLFAGLIPISAGAIWWIAFVGFD
jgi:hypothetical protein